jgi:small subunit ribosomal protein S9
MAKTEAVKDLSDLGTASAEAKAREPKLDNKGRSYGTGRRKESVARVWVQRGKGKIIVNGKPQEQYFGRQTHLLVLDQPFLVANRVGEFDVMCTVAGGGLSGQAGAIRHGISRALDNFEPALHTTLKKAGFLTRDARQVERKKVGKHKARRSKQWAKR